MYKKYETNANGLENLIFEAFERRSGIYSKLCTIPLAVTTSIGTFKLQEIVPL